MFSLLQIIDMREADSGPSAGSLVTHLNEVSSALPHVVSAQAGLTLPRALNGGQLMWRLGFNCEQDCWASMTSAAWQAEVMPRLSHEHGVMVDTVAYRTDFRRVGGRSQGGIWRCLVLAVDATTPAEDVRQLQRDLMLMPEHIPAIRDWALGQVTWSRGRRRWTHVWEQEFDTLSGLEVDYMVHPIHWGLVDGWFDPECPQRIVDPFLVHAAFAIEGALIGRHSS
jgi:hypothetical protein